MRSESEVGERRWQWQGKMELSRIALELVFAWLEGAELARAGAVSRAWWRVASTPALWRRLLAAHAPLSRSAQLAMRNPQSEVRWRQLYVETVAGWEAVGQLQSSGGLLHATLCPRGKRLALLATDATVSIWERRESGPKADEWVERWCVCLRGRGWASAERGEWASEGTRLLVAGTRSLLQHDSWELLVLHEAGEGWEGRARARASAGAAGCWADAAGETFLSFELRSLATGLAATTVWLNTATQETQSEYAGVTTPLLRIFNEGGHLLRALVAEVPVDNSGDKGFLVGASNDDEAYARATRTEKEVQVTQVRVLVAEWGRRGGGAVGTWALVECRPPPLLAETAGDLRARLLRRRAARAAAPPPAEREPTEAEVRALCTPPDAVCPLPARPTGLVAHPNGCCVWVCWTGGGGACLSLPTLTPLRVLACSNSPSPGDPSPAFDHYTQPAVSPSYFAAPAGGMAGAVHVWSVAVRGRRVDGEPLRLLQRGAALAALLPSPQRSRINPTYHEPNTLLVLTSDVVNVWRSRATFQPSFDFNYYDDVKI